MSTTVRRTAFALCALGLLASPLAIGAAGAAGAPALAPVAETPVGPPAARYVPPPGKKLTAADLRLQFGPGARQIRLVSAQGDPLALIAVSTTGAGKVSIVSSGTDFTQPSVWRERGFGDMCWRLEGFGDATTYTLPGPVVPFATVPAIWRYSNVIVSTENGPIVYNNPQQGQYVSGEGLPIKSAVVCLKVVPRSGAVRADPTTSPTASAAPITPITPVAPITPITPTVTATATAPAGAKPLPRPTSAPSSTSASAAAASATSAPPAPQADKPDGGDKKITICHATSSNSNPYNLITISTNAINGHDGHTGPLYPQVGWGDVIPPIDDYPGMNWPAGEGLLAAGCVVAPAPSPTPTPTPTDPGGFGLAPVPITPERPARPQPPIIVVPPRPTPSPTPTASPSGTASNPIATTTPRPTRPPRPSATASNPIATTTPRPTRPPRPTATAGSPFATVTPVATGTGSPSPSATGSSTPTPVPSSTSGGGGTGTAAPSSTPTDASAIPSATGVPTAGPTDGTSPTDAVSAPDCSNLEITGDSPEVRFFLTNGVSVLEVTRAYDRLQCIVSNRTRPVVGGGTGASSGSASPDATLVDTGSNTRAMVTASLIMVGLGLLLVPGLARRR